MFANVTYDVDIRGGDDAAGNYGASDDIACDAVPPRAGLIRFDVSAIDPAWTIVSARLFLWTLDCSGCALDNVGRVELFRVVEQWNEGQLRGGPGAANWTERMPGVLWSTPGVEPPSRETIVQGEIWASETDREYMVPLSPVLIEEWVSDPATNYGLVLRGNPYSDDSANFWTSDYVADPSKRPQLEVEVIR